MHNRVIIIGLALLATVCGWQWYQTQLRADSLVEQLETMESHARDLEKQVVDMQAKINELEGRGIESIIDDANGSVVDTWDTLIDSLQEQLGEFGNLIKEELEEQLGTGESPPDKTEKNKPNQKRI